MRRERIHFSKRVETKPVEDEQKARQSVRKAESSRHKTNPLFLCQEDETLRM